MRTTLIRLAVLAGITAVLVFPLQAGAKKNESSQTFTPDARFGQWRTALQERVVKTITAEVMRVRGGDKTFINARFGREGQTFDGGRRVYLKDTEWNTITWTVNQAPNGKDLILNAYDGEVQLRKVTVQY